mmetsp:Transcript_27079/g.78148  ORF Transcript_27079/g.78148 Transcript_27079/m.78148 type:complete len:93 (-) Transcript_27079:91-369(-)
MPGRRNALGDCVWLIAGGLAFCADDDGDDEDEDERTENPSTETTAEQAKTATNTWTGIEILIVSCNYFCCSLLTCSAFPLCERIQNTRCAPT